MWHFYTVKMKNNHYLMFNDHRYYIGAWDYNMKLKFYFVHNIIIIIITINIYLFTYNDHFFFVCSM